MRSSRKLAIVVAALLLGGCESFLDVNEDPNDPETAIADLRIASLVTGFGHSVYYLGPTLWTGEWMQQYSYNGSTRSYDEVHRYELQENSPNGPWELYYSDILNEARLIMEETDAEADAAIHGLAKFIWAWTWAHTTDMWGPVPFTEAFDPLNPDPVYDEQQVVYDAVHAWFDEAVAEMRTASARSPGARDLLFEDDMERWARLARVVQARHHLRLAYAPWEDATQRAQAALAALEEGFTSNSDDADFVYPGGSGARNPLWMFQNLEGQLTASEYVIEEMLRPRDDPRLPILVMPALTDLEEGETVYRGHRNGAGEQPDSSLSEVGHDFTDEDALLNWASYADAKFTEAEARLILGDVAAADEAYRAGIRANMEKLGVAQADIDAYLSARAPLASLAAPLEEIIREKYIANYLKIEPWNDWRRTGYPRLEVVDEAFMAGIPVRIRTPAVEADRNGENVRATGISAGLEGMLWKDDRVWWGGSPATP